MSTFGTALFGSLSDIPTFQSESMDGYLRPADARRCLA
jgi:hypothetical protein